MIGARQGNSPMVWTSAPEGGDAGGAVGGHLRPPERHRQRRPDRLARGTRAGSAGRTVAGVTP